jgi:NADH-ubiquinone oxidoreductase chain 5
VHGQFFYWLSIISAILTVYYSTRLLLLVFIKQFLGFKWYILNYLKVTKLEIYLLGFLGTLSIISGFYFKDLFIGFGSNYFNNSIYNITSTWSLVDLEFIPVFIKVIPLFLSIISFYIALLLNKKSINLTYVNTLETNFEMCKWYFNEILNNYLALPILISSRYIFEQYEKRILDNHGPIFFINLVKRTINSN